MGSNFSIRAEDNVVTFSSVRGEVVSATQSELLVVVPTRVGLEAAEQVSVELPEGPVALAAARVAVTAVDRFRAAPSREALDLMLEEGSLGR